jgi:hypothetical protein
VVDSCEQGNELLGSMENVVTRLVTISFSRRTLSMVLVGLCWTEDELSVMYWSGCVV